MIISIEELENSPEGKLLISFDEIISDLQNDTSVKGQINVVSKGIVIEVSGVIETDLKLECDRCLKEFLHHIELDIDEKYVKGTIVNEDIKEFEIKNEDFVEELGKNKEIDITELIYQNIVINTPVKKLCDNLCKGSEELDKYLKEKEEDPRLQVFKDLKDKLK